MKTPEEVETIIVASGGNGDGLGYHAGATLELLKYFEKTNRTLDAWVGTSAGSIIGGMIASRPDTFMAEMAKLIYLDLTAEKVFGNWWTRTVVPLWRLNISRFSPNKYDSIASTKPIKKLLKDILSEDTFGELKIPLVTIHDDIRAQSSGWFNPYITPHLPIWQGVYASMAQPPYLQPYYGLGTYIDGGSKAIIPFEPAKKLFVNLKEVWILSKNKYVPRNNKNNINGLLNIIQESFDSIMALQLNTILESATNDKDGIETHIIIDGLNGLPSGGFFDFFDSLKEYVGIGETNMINYLKNPKPVMLKRK